MNGESVMNKWMNASAICWLVFSVPVAGLLGFSALRHMDNSYFFLSSIYSYQIFGPWTGVVIASIVPCLQLTLAILVLFDTRAERWAFGISVCLFALFVAIQVSALKRELPISCGCFGNEERQIGWQSITSAASGLVLSLLGTIFGTQRKVST
jgi:hypothetical protein